MTESQDLHFTDVDPGLLTSLSFPAFASVPQRFVGEIKFLSICKTQRVSLVGSTWIQVLSLGLGRFAESKFKVSNILQICCAN